MPLFFGNYASASTGVANFLPNIFYGPSQNGFDTANEQTLSLNIAKAITSELASYNSPYGCYYSYESTCTVSSYYSILNTLKTYNDKEVVFSKGHRGLPYWNATPPNTVHRALIANDGKNFGLQHYRSFSC
ncbi:MAG: hypothetical protein LBI09_01075 [Nitrososphaerota archaeon]|nr:hypothetical protein [Nitrososphaerota archaeon]